MALTFRGGIHLNEHKDTASCPIETFPAPGLIYIPMQQHIGAPCTPVVKVGDTVLRGQLVGIADKGLGAHVHSSVSGIVKEIKSTNDANGRPLMTVVIENDGKMTVSDDVIPFEKKYNKKISEITADDLVSVVKDAGISGMGGATFPTHVKISSAIGKVTRVIINCAECEPYITANHRLMLENPDRIIDGLIILVKAFGLDEGIIAIEDNKNDAIELINSKTANMPNVRVIKLKTKYPQGDERQLIYAITGQELPAGKLPADVGCVIFNAETCSAISVAVNTGMSLVERVVTVAGDCIQTPKNLLVPLGTMISEVIDYCGRKGKIRKIVSGGPMMGVALSSESIPVVKGSSAILALSEKEDRDNSVNEACIRCGRCVSNCPMRLMPVYLAAYAKKNDWDMAEKFGVTSCVECGSCTYICPGNVPLVQYIRIAKTKVMENQRAKAAASKAAEAKNADTKNADAKGGENE